MIDWQHISRKRTILIKTYVFSNSVWCMGRISENPASAWKERIDLSVHSSQCGELDRIDAEPMEFEWFFSRIHYIADFRRDPRT